MKVFGELYREMNFKELFNSFYQPLVNFATRHIADADVAEDIVQELFITIWDKELRFENLIALKTYLYRSVLNRCQNYLRDHKLRFHHEQELVLQQQEGDNSLMNEVIREEVYRQLTAAVDSFPPQCRKVFDMVQKGMKSSEIAKELGLAEETVKRHRKIARKILQEKLGKYFFLCLFVKFF